MLRSNDPHPLQILLSIELVPSAQIAEPRRATFAGPTAEPALANGGLRVQVVPLEEV